MSREARSRVVLGAGIPIAALVFLGILIFAFSRILLAVPETLAPWVALLFAAVILVGCTLAALIPGTRGFAFLISMLVGTIVVGGVVGLVIGERPVHSLVEEGEHVTAEEPEENAPALSDEPEVMEEAPVEPPPPKAGGGAGGATAPIAAQSLAFSASELSLPADTPSVIAFDNQDQGIPHNVSIYTAQGGDPLFQGEIVNGPAKIDYEVPPLEAGELFFQCDVHPTTMTGTVTVA